MNEDKRSLLFLIAVVTLLIFITLGVISADKLNNSDDHITNENTDEKNTEQPVEENDENNEDDQLPSVNALLIGFDKSLGLTDVIMVAHLDTDTNEIKMISLPRDLMIDFRDDKFKHIKENNKNIRINYCKLTEVYSNAGWDEQALLNIKEIVSIITGLDLDYMSAVNTDGFKEIVDVIGGVDFYVPQRMYYNDPAQNLHINLYEGLQFLDGDKAEQLVRFRRYRGSTPPDIQRIKVQQEFLTVLSDKVLKIRDFNKIRNLVQAVMEHLTTDFGLTVAYKYSEYLFDLDLDTLLSTDNMIIIPSESEKIDGLWFQKWEEDEVMNEIETLLSR